MLLLRPNNCRWDYRIYKMYPVQPPSISKYATVGKFEVMSTKMNTIDDIKRTVLSIDSKVSEMKQDMDSLSKPVSEVESSQTLISKSFEENSKKVEHGRRQVDNDIKKLSSLYESLRRDLDGVKSDAKKVTETKENLSKIVKANEKLSYEFENIQCESMRDNLLFHGLKEKVDEDCIQLIKRICSNELGGEDDLNIKVAYRLGKKVDTSIFNPSNDTERTRPVLVKFSDR